MKRIKQLVLHPLFSGSAVMIVGSNLANFIAYLYHLVIGRMLGPELYGELASVISLVGLFAVSFTFLGMVIMKFVSAADANEKKRLFSWFLNKTSKMAIGIGILILILSPLIANFLKIELSVSLLIGPIISVFFLAFVYSSFLQGLLRFGKIVIASNLGMIARLGLSLLFVYLGYSVFGATFGILIAGILGLFINRYFLKDYKATKNEGRRDLSKTIFTYAAPLFLFALSINSLYSTDVLLVKHFFEAKDAGIYAALSNLGKIIFFGAAPVGSVMFPLISQRQAQGKDIKRVFFLSVIITLAISLGVLFIYWWIPQLTLKILYGNRFLDAASYLIWFGIFMALFTLGSLVANFFMSKGDTKVWSLVFVSGVAQAVGIWFLHGSIIQVITVNIAVATFLLVCLLIYFGYQIYGEKR